MSDKPETTSVQDESQAPMSLDALARRRALLAGLGKGGAVLAATVPIQSLAGGSVLTCKSLKNGGTVIATVSGAQSNGSSLGLGSTPQVPACGKKPIYWKTATWPSGCSKSSYYVTIFGDKPTGVGNTTTCWNVINNPTAYGTNSDCAEWVAAWLNGASMYLPGSGTFPYPHLTTGNVKGVVDWYKSGDRTNAYLFFKSIHTAT